MDYQRGDNRAQRGGSYGDRERERRERAAAARREERERFEQRQKSRYHARQPQQGTWYERPPAQRAQAPRTQDARGPRTQGQRGRRSVPLQHQQYQSGGYAQQQSRPRPPRAPQRSPQLSRGYSSAPALDSRDIGIRVAIVAVLLVVFIARIATFGGCAESSDLDTQISEQQAQLQQVSDGNVQAQSQLDSMQSAIDSYDQLVSSSASSSESASDSSSASGESDSSAESDSSSESDSSAESAD